MDVYLVPTGADQYELYCETPAPAPDPPRGDPAAAGPSQVRASLRARLRDRWVTARDSASSAFTRAVAEGEDHRLGIVPDQPPSRIRRFITRKLADAVAEQRLLWHLRRQDHARLVYPDDLNDSRAIELSRRLLSSDRDKHRRWLIIDALLTVASTPFALLPGPNVLAYYFIFRTVGHLLSMRGAAQGLVRVTWVPAPSPHLTALREVIPMAAAARADHLQQISEALGLDRLGLFIERVADRPS